jgi:hypothetical protein
LGTIGRAPWSLEHFLAVVAVASLAVIVMPGCAWLIRSNPQPYYFDDAGLEPGGGPAGTTLVNPLPPPEVREGASRFLLPNIDYRSLGGVFVYDGHIVIVKPRSEDNAALDENDVTTGLAFGQLVAAHYDDRLDIVVPEDCIGSDIMTDVIKVRQVADPKDEVAAVLACARMRDPGARWIGSTLEANARGALSHVVLQRQDGTRFGVFVDVSRFVAQHGALQ